MHQYMLGADHVESNFAEKALRFLVVTKLNVSQQCCLAAKETNGVLVCIRSPASTSREVVLSFHSALVKSHVECCSVLGSPLQE